MIPAVHRVSVQLPPDLSRYLSERVKRQCTTQSAYLRDLLVRDRDERQAQQRAA